MAHAVVLEFQSIKHFLEEEELLMEERIIKWKNVAFAFP